MEKVIVIGGGDSSERAVSLVTSKTIRDGLIQAGYAAKMIDTADFSDWFQLFSYLKKANPDMLFLGLHGAAGEDGRIQSALELLNLPYTGSGSHASSLAMDKNTSLSLAAEAGLDVAEHFLLDQENQKSDNNKIKLKTPLVIKPNSSGSSVGITIIDRREDFDKALETAGRYDRFILCEKYIAGREITVTVLDEDALPPVEIKPLKGWYDYKNKYTSGNTEYICPAELTEEETNTVQKAAEKIFKRLGCRVYARIDFRYDNEKFYFLEVNTLPGMTSLSLTPMAAKAAGIDLPQLLAKIVQLSKQKKDRLCSLPKF